MRCSDKRITIAIGIFIRIKFNTDRQFSANRHKVHGNLFSQVDQTMKLLLTKYMKAYISYDGIHSVEKFLIPETAWREALLNAIAKAVQKFNTKAKFFKGKNAKYGYTKPTNKLVYTALPYLNEKILLCRYALQYCFTRYGRRNLYHVDFM